MPIGAFKLNGIGKFTVTAVAQVLRSKKGIAAIGNAQIDTAQSKFGGASLLLDGTGDYLYSTSPLSLGTGDWTIELWIRTGIANKVFFDNRIPTSSAGVFFLNASGYASYYDNTTGTISGTTNCADTTWRHIAYSKSGSTLRIFVNGTVEHTKTSYAQDMGTDRSFVVGAQFDGAIPINGWLDELRISNTARYTTGFTPSTTPFVNDSSTVLLLHMDGTDATTVFEDDNGTGRSQIGISAIGNAQIDTAQSYFGGSSLLCDGTGDYLTCGSASDFNFGSTSFTIEYWIRFNVAPTLYVPIASRFSGNIFNGEWWCEITAAEKKMYWGFKNTAGTTYYVNLALAGTAFTTGQWYHIALVNNAGTAQMYVNGTATGATSALTGSFGNYSPLYIGALGPGGYSLNGWIDEVRISGSARYTANFTPATTPFVNDANTKFLCHMDGTDATTVFRDDNGVNGRNILALGNAQISTAQSKFGGSSALFDGTGDYLQTSIAALGSGDFTVECWANANSGFTNRGILHLGATLFPANTTGLAFAFENTGSNGVTFYRGGSAIATSTARTAGVWYHIAISRSGTTTKCFVDGTEVNSLTDTTNYTQTELAIGGYYNTSYLWNGYIDEVRISNSARYTANFTPSTTPFQNDSNTLLLIHADGTNASTAFIDSTSRIQRGIIANGNAQIDTAQSKFGGSSALFDGTTDWLRSAMVGSGYTATDLTIECWVRPAAIQTKAIMTSRTADNTLATGEFQLMFLDSSFSTKFQFALGNSQVDMRSTTTYAANTWYHLAVTRNTATNGWTFYVNGTSEATATNATNFANLDISIGAYLTGSISMNGHVDEVRISNTRRYTANFTPSTTPFQNDSNTLLLMHMDGTDGSNIFIDDNGVYPA